MSFLRELNRRNVFRVGVAYAVTAWLLIQIAETIFPLFGFDETPARIVVMVLAIGFMPVLVLAWAFEWTPEGLKRETEVDRSRLAVAGNARRLDRLIMVVLALALGYFAFDKFVLDPARDAALVEETVQQARSDALVESYGEHSIAVLPFANLSNDPEQEYFSDGIAEELLNLLAQVPRLRVISRSSSFAFKGQAINVPVIAKQLGVNHVLEGSVRKQGDRVRITAQLIEARSDTHLWSQTYERTLDDVFAIQDEISAAIVRELGAKLALDLISTAQARAPVNTEAYEAYLRGRHLMTQRTREAMSGAVEEFQNAVELDPEYALGHASLAIAISLSADYGLLSEAEAIEVARPHAERAIELDPKLAEAHAALGWVDWRPESLSEAERHFRAAIELNPNYSDAMTWLGHFSMTRNEYADGFALYQAAARIDPLSIPAKNSLINGLMARGRLVEARQELQKLASLQEAGYFAWMPYIASLNGNWSDGALAILEGMRNGYGGWNSSLQVNLVLLGMENEVFGAPADLNPSPYRMAGLGEEAVWVLRLLGRPADAITTWEQLPGGIPREPGPGYLPSGVLFAAAGDTARAETVLERVWPIFHRTAGIGTPSRDANFILALMSVRQARGDGAGVSELEAALKDAVRRYAEAGLVICDAFEGCVHFDAGISAYLDGRREEGLALIERSVESGYFIPPNQAYLQFLYDDPGFEAVLEKQRAHQARQREKFLAVVCAENPYEDIWQPMEETCAHFEGTPNAD